MFNCRPPLDRHCRCCAAARSTSRPLPLLHSILLLVLHGICSKGTASLPVVVRGLWFPLTRRHFFPADDCKFALKSGAECWMEHTETTTTLTRKPKPKFWLHATMLIETVEVDGHFFSSVWHFCFCRLAGAFGGFRCFWASIRGVRWVNQPLPVILATRDDVTLSSTTPVKVAGTGGWLAGQKLADSAILEVYFVEVRTHPWQYHVIHTRCRTDDCEHCTKVLGRYNSFL